MKQTSLAIAVLGPSARAPNEPSPIHPEIVSTAEQARVTQCPYLDPMDPNFYGSPRELRWAEILITRVPVVDDPCRTS